MFIKDGSELIGMLCINFDAAKYSRMAQELLALCGPIRSPAPALGGKLRQQPARRGAGRHHRCDRHRRPAPDRLTMDEKIRIVDDLQQAGIFYMKGAVSEVAAQLAPRRRPSTAI